MKLLFAGLGVGLALLIAGFAVLAAASKEQRPYNAGPCAEASAKSQIAPDGEPGTPLVVRGRVFRPDGTTPAAGVILYVYHTDINGLYNRQGLSGARLQGWLRTATDGSYEYRTIRPAPYPGRTAAAHIHTQLWGDGVPPQYGTDLLFDDDPLVSDSERHRSGLGRFAFVKKTRNVERVLHVEHDLQLQLGGAEFEENTMHGLKPCE